MNCLITCRTMGMTFFTLKLMDFSPETLKSFNRTSLREKSRLAALYDRMFPPIAVFDEPYTPLGILWTVQLDPESIIKRLDEDKCLSVRESSDLVRWSSKNQVLLKRETILCHYANNADSFATIQNYIDYANTDEGADKLIAFYSQRRAAFSAFIRAALDAGSPIEVQANL